MSEEPFDPSSFARRFRNCLNIADQKEILQKVDTAISRLREQKIKDIPQHRPLIEETAKTLGLPSIEGISVWILWTQIQEFRTELQNLETPP